MQLHLILAANSHASGDVALRLVGFGERAGQQTLHLPGIDPKALLELVDEIAAHVVLGLTSDDAVIRMNVKFSTVV